MDQQKAGSREPAFFDLALVIVQEQLTHPIDCCHAVSMRSELHIGRERSGFAHRRGLPDGECRRCSLRLPGSVEILVWLRASRARRFQDKPRATDALPLQRSNQSASRNPPLIATTSNAPVRRGGAGNGKSSNRQPMPIANASSTPSTARLMRRPAGQRGRWVRRNASDSLRHAVPGSGRPVHSRTSSPAPAARRRRPWVQRWNAGHTAAEADCHAQRDTADELPIHGHQISECACGGSAAPPPPTKWRTTGARSP